MVFGGIAPALRGGAMSMGGIAPALRGGAMLMLLLGACAHGEQAGAKMPADAVTVRACSCPQGPPDQLQSQPTHEQVIDAMKMARAGVRECTEEPGSVTVTVAIDGASGLVTEVDVENPRPDSEACVARAMRQICFPRFKDRVFKVRFPFRVGPRSASEQATKVAPSCPVSAMPWLAEDEAKRVDDAARAGARQSYQARYGAACEAELAGQKPMPAGSLPKTIDAEVKESALREHIDQAQACYRDALAGWPDLAGTIDIQLVVDAGGSVESSHVASTTFALTELGCCLRQVTRRLRFPAQPASSLVSYDFTFRP